MLETELLIVTKKILYGCVNCAHGVFREIGKERERERWRERERKTRRIGKKNLPIVPRSNYMQSTTSFIIHL